MLNLKPSDAQLRLPVKYSKLKKILNYQTYIEVEYKRKAENVFYINVIFRQKSSLRTFL